MNKFGKIHEIFLYCLTSCCQGNGRGRICTSSGVSSVWAVMGGVSGSSGLHRQDTSNCREIWNLQNSPPTSKYLLMYILPWYYIQCEMCLGYIKDTSTWPTDCTLLSLVVCWLTLFCSGMVFLSCKVSQSSWMLIVKCVRFSFERE